MKYGMTDKEMNERRYAETALPRRKHLMADLGSKMQADMREAKRALELADLVLSRNNPGDRGKYRIAFKKIMGKESKA